MAHAVAWQSASNKSQTRFHLSVVKAARCLEEGSRFSRGSVGCTSAYVSLSARMAACVCVSLKAACLHCGAAEALPVALALHRLRHTSCIHRHRPLPAFDVRSAAQPADHGDAAPRPNMSKGGGKKEGEKKRERERTLLSPINMFLLSNGRRRSCLISADKKQAVRVWALWGV